MFEVIPFMQRSCIGGDQLRPTCTAVKISLLIRYPAGLCNDQSLWEPRREGVTREDVPSLKSFKDGRRWCATMVVNLEKLMYLSGTEKYSRRQIEVKASGCSPINTLACTRRSHRLCTSFANFPRGFRDSHILTNCSNAREAHDRIHHRRP